MRGHTLLVGVMTAGSELAISKIGVRGVEGVFLLKSYEESKKVVKTKKKVDMVWEN